MDIMCEIRLKLHSDGKQEMELFNKKSTIIILFWVYRADDWLLQGNFI